MWCGRLACTGQARRLHYRLRHHRRRRHCEVPVPLLPDFQKHDGPIRRRTAPDGSVSISVVQTINSSAQTQSVSADGGGSVQRSRSRGRPIEICQVQSSAVFATTWQRVVPSGLRALASRITSEPLPRVVMFGIYDLGGARRPSMRQEWASMVIAREVLKAGRACGRGVPRWSLGTR